MSDQENEILDEMIDEVEETVETPTDAPAEKPKVGATKQKEETVEIPKSQLSALLGRLDRLEAAADKGQLARYDSKNKEKLPTECNVRVVEGKIVTAWSTVQNIVEQNPVTNAWFEKQTVALYFLGEDKPSPEIDYRTWERSWKVQKARVLGERKDLESGVTFWKVRTVHEDDTTPQEFEIDIRFIN